MAQRPEVQLVDGCIQKQFFLISGLVGQSGSRIGDSSVVVGIRNALEDDSKTR